MFLMILTWINIFIMLYFTVALWFSFRINGNNSITVTATICFSNIVLRWCFKELLTTSSIISLIWFGKVSIDTGKLMDFTVSSSWVSSILSIFTYAEIQIPLQLCFSSSCPSSTLTHFAVIGYYIQVQPPQWILISFSSLHSPFSLNVFSTKALLLWWILLSS